MGEGVHLTLSGFQFAGLPICQENTRKVFRFLLNIHTDSPAWELENKVKRLLCKWKS